MAQENVMARTEEGWITPPPPTNESRGVAGGPTTEDIVQVLQDRYGDEYQESYEEGKRQFRDAIVDAFGVERDTASALVDDLEQSGTIRFHRQGVGADVEVPRVGLFDVPETATPDRTEREYAGRYWVIGRRDFVPGKS
jgi:hypothetical protein